jgi:hypothetical protein
VWSDAKGIQLWGSRLCACRIVATVQLGGDRYRVGSRPGFFVLSAPPCFSKRVDSAKAQIPTKTRRSGVSKVCRKMRTAFHDRKWGHGCPPRRRDAASEIT